jgi:hypothetical protein
MCRCRVDLPAVVLAVAAWGSEIMSAMTDPKPFASLSPTLLARKGHAKPAMRPQSFRLSNDEQNAGFRGAQLDDLGWNDMGTDVPAAPVTPVALHAIPARSETSFTPAESPVVLAQQEQLVQQFESVRAVPEPVASLPSKPAPVMAVDSKRKAAFTLRLDRERHLRLRLVSAVNHRSAQQIVTLALDEFLARQPDNATLIG